MATVLPKRVILEDQGIRDGFQNLPFTIPTAKKVAFIHQLVDAGLKRIQFGSFVHPELVPQMADTKEVYRRIEKKEGVIYSGLVLNGKGLERALQAGVKHLAISISASNTHSRKNTRKSLEESQEAFKGLVKEAKAARVVVRGGIQCAFGCRYEGKIAKATVLDMVRSHLDLGVDELALADSTGMADPLAMQHMMQEVIALTQGLPVILHLHNTENKGLANLYAAMEAGVHHFDTAFGGLGGCPFIKNATGNVATEDAIHMLHQMNIKTGIDARKVAEVSQLLESELGQPLPGLTYPLFLRNEVEMV